MKLILMLLLSLNLSAQFLNNSLIETYKLYPDIKEVEQTGVFLHIDENVQILFDYSDGAYRNSAVFMIPKNPLGMLQIQQLIKENKFIEVEDDEFVSVTDIGIIRLTIYYEKGFVMYHFILQKINEVKN